MSNEEDENKLEQPLNLEEQDKNSRKKKIIFIAVILLAVILIVVLALIIFKSNEDEEKKDEPQPKPQPDPETMPIYINPTGTYKYCIIWLHGLDNKPENFVDLFTKEIKIPFPNNTKLVLMRAPKMNLTYNKEEKTSWFDLNFFPINSTESYNFNDALKSSESVRKIVEQESKLLNGHYENIYVGGHSQGACISVLNGYNSNYLLGGIIACSGVLFPEAEIIGDKDKLNVYFGHGDVDKAIPLFFHNETVKRIENYTGVKRYYYPGHGHSISEQEKSDISKFLFDIMK